MRLCEISCKIVPVLDCENPDFRVSYTVVIKTVKNNGLGIDSWRSSEYAERYFNIERTFIDAGLRQSIGPTVLQLGQCLPDSVVDDFDLPFLIKTSETLDGSSDVVVDPAFLPFSFDVFSTVVLPHVLERHRLPHQVLREAHRVLMPEGHIVLTGFNPRSFLGLQRWLRPKAVCAGRYYSAEAVSVSSVEQDLGTWRKKPLALHSFQGCHLRDLWVLIEPDEIQDLL